MHAVGRLDVDPLKAGSLAALARASSSISSVMSSPVRNSQRLAGKPLGQQAGEGDI
jgi:hypothetical protein